MDEDRFWPGANPDEDVPKVDVPDLKAVRGLYKAVEGMNPGQQGCVGIDIEIVRAACSAGADVGAVSYRYSMLQLLTMFPGDLLAPWSDNGEFHDAVFKVAARIQMKWIEVGVPQPRLPFDLEVFLQEVRKASL
ncbi:MAG TPA: hypothetical protein VIX14_16420 [Terriglobales bacterium]